MRVLTRRRESKAAHRPYHNRESGTAVPGKGGVAGEATHKHAEILDALSQEKRLLEKNVDETASVRRSTALG
jgi:hypothetical protein